MAPAHSAGLEKGQNRPGSRSFPDVMPVLESDRILPIGYRGFGLWIGLAAKAADQDRGDNPGRRDIRFSQTPLPSTLRNRGKAAWSSLRDRAVGSTSQLPEARGRSTNFFSFIK